MVVQIECICPPKADGEPRHVADTVELLPKLGFRAVDTIKTALAMMYAEDDEAGIPEVLGVIREGYLLQGVVGWSLVGEDGKPLAVTKPNIRQYLLADPDAAEVVADATDDLYRDAVMRPLLRLALKSSPNGQTEASTSQPTGSSDTPTPRPSSPSSTTTTPTDATTTMHSSPDGDSKSSPNLVSVA